MPVNVFAIKVSDNAYDENGRYIYRTNTYDFPMPSDPQRVTDKEFFGEWDAELGGWTTPSMFRYDDEPDLYPDMKPIADAVKSGDYVLAKQELMDYYTPKKYEFVAYSSGSISDNARTQADLLMRNFYALNQANGFVRDIVKVENTQWQEYEADVIDAVNATISGKQDKMTITLMSIDKSNTPAEVMARESGMGATLTIVANGVSRTIPVYEDAYMQAGSYANFTFGTSDVLYAQEYGYEGHWDANRLTEAQHEQLNKAPNDWGEESSPTRRPFIKFDIPYGEGDNIESATLTFTARVAPSDENNDYDLTSKELLVYQWMDSNWTEATLKWNMFSDWFCVSANEQDYWDYITTNSTGSKGKMCYFHRGNAINILGPLYENTGDERYAYTFLRNQMAVINTVGVNEVVMNALDMSGHLSRMGRNGFIRLWGSNRMTPEIFTAILKHYVQMADYIKERWVWRKAYTNNWATYCTEAIYCMGVIYEELDLSEEWIASAQEDNKSLLLGGERLNGTYHEGHVFRDGQCIELAQGYIGTLLGTYSSALGVQKRIGSVMPFDDDGLNAMKMIVKNMVYQAAPNYVGFNMADSMDYSGGITSTVKTWYDLLLYDDPEVEYVVTGGKSGKLPDFTSISYPIGLRTYMRNGWGKDDIAICFTAKTDGSHGHSDVLSFAMWGYGQFLLTDQSYGAMQTDSRMAYMKSAQQHNLITINDGNHPKGYGYDGVEEEQELNDFYNFTTYSSVHFDGADYSQRSILFLKGQKFFIVNDYIIPTNKESINKYTQFWHMLPSSGIYITDDGKNQIRSNFTETANVIVAGADTESMYDIYLADSVFSPTAGAFVASKKGVYERREAGNVSYSTVVYPVDKGDDFDVQVEKIETGIADHKASALWTRITDNNSGEFNDYYYYHLNDTSLTPKPEITIGKYSTDASSLLVEEDINGNVISVFIYDGTYVKSSSCVDEFLFKSTQPKTLGYKLNGSNMVEISTDKVINDPDNLRTAFVAEDLKDLTIYVGANSRGAVHNLDIVSGSSKSGGYLYFGDTPIVTGTETDTSSDYSGNNNANNNLGDNHGGGSGSVGGGGGGGAPKPPKEDEPVEDEPVNPEQNVDPVPSTPSYNDVDEDDWFYEYVQELTDKGIVSGDGSGAFVPQDNVTREQFIKMLLIASDVETDEGENTFEDVSAGAWFKPYVLTAKKLGIVNGISDVTFGIGSNITRQDMAVMISRMIDKLDVEIDTSDVEKFADDENVSDYAKDSVTFMKSIGLIEGYNNEFRPMDKLTRAEASKVICQLLKLIVIE